MFDAATMSEVWARPGMDTRQWVAIGTVDVGTDSAPCVTFTQDYGPLVDVTLRTGLMNTSIRCRVANSCAGVGEGEWHPFAGGEEVLVAIPEGDERVSCTIIGRLNQSIDKWPEQVAGQDTTKNTIAFKRLIPPYILESQHAILLRIASVKSFLSLDPGGSITAANGDGAYLSLGHTLLGIVDSDGNSTMQIDREQKLLTLAVATAAGKGAMLQLSAQDQSSITTQGELLIGTSGNGASAHAMGVEHLASILTALATIIALDIRPLTGPFLADDILKAVAGPLWVAAQTVAVPPTVGAAIGAALSKPVDVITGALGIAAPGLLIG